MAVKHATTATGADDPTKEINKGEWNANHTIDAGTITTTELGGDITTAGKALLDDAAASDQRTTLGLGTIATQAANSVAITGGSITGITDLAIADGGTGSSDAETACENLASVRIMARGNVDVASTTTSLEEALVPITIPIASNNDILRVSGILTVSGNGNTKTFRARSDGLTGSIHFTADVTGSTGLLFSFVIACRNATNSQVSYGMSIEGSSNTLGHNMATATAIQWNTGSVVLALTSQKATTTDTFTINHYLVERLSTGS